MSEQRVLVVDDDGSIRETLVAQLGAAGYACSAVASAEHALAMVRDFDPGVVITDLRMSGMTGLELLAALRERLPEVDVIVITAYEDMETAMSAIKAGARDFIVKPFDLEQLESVVARSFRDRALRRRAQFLATAAAEPYAMRKLVGRDPKMIALSKSIGALAATRSPVLIRGETGTGKELIARTIHFNSPAAAEPFIAINCTAIPESLLESELFGHVRGAFTGAAADRKGRFELAGTGTIFLDEIGDVSPAFQTKLLRVLQDGEFYPVGAERPRRTTARVIAATHRPLEQLVRAGTFREDLYYRLRVVELVIPPLRERRADIRPLVDALMRRIQRELHRQLIVPEAVLRALEQHDWPGNVRELENSLTRAAVLARGSVIEMADLALERRSDAGTNVPSDDLTLGAAILAHVRRVLAMQGGAKRAAARALGISRPRLERILAGEPDSNRDRDGAGTMPDAARDEDDPNGQVVEE